MEWHCMARYMFCYLMIWHRIAYGMSCHRMHMECFWHGMALPHMSRRRMACGKLWYGLLSMIVYIAYIGAIRGSL